MSKVLPPSFTFINLLHALSNASMASALSAPTVRALKNAMKLYETAQTREEALTSLQAIADIIKRDANKIDPLLAKASGNFLGGTRRFQTSERLRAELAAAFIVQDARAAIVPAYVGANAFQIHGSGKASLTASDATTGSDWDKRVWESSPTLRSYELPSEEKDPIFYTVSFLISKKDRIDTELEKKFSFIHLMRVLITQGKIRGDVHAYHRAGGALDLFFTEGNPMQQLKKGELKTPEETVRWIINHKRALDSLAKRGKTYSYGILMNALWYGGRIQENFQACQWAGGAIQYLFKKWDQVGPLILKVYQGEKMKPQERDQFTTLKGDRPLSQTYRKAIIRWGRFLVENNLTPPIN